MATASSTCNMSAISRPDPNMSIVTCFSNLPLDIRLLIWEYFLPPSRNLKITNKRKKIAVIDKEDPGTYYEDSISVGEIKTTLKPPILLLSACRESRELALASGRFVAKTTDPDNVRMVWADRNLRTVYMSLSAASFSILKSLPRNAQTVACLWPKPSCFKQFRFYVDYFNRRRIVPIKTIYVGLSAIIYDNRWADADTVERFAGSPFHYDSSGFNVVGLDDPRLPTLLNLAWVSKSWSCYHHSPECFLDNLNRYWQNDKRALKLRSVFHTDEAGSTEPSLSQTNLPDIKPAIIFGRTKEELFFGECRNYRVEERAAGLLFTKSDVHGFCSPGGSARFYAALNTRFDCNNACGHKPSGSTH
ncbi:hypothetical protein NM208_g675 [Fusarium decemcellulare]|uniref:Uncharacterized protein n=1 Tax=Fusarium decemcellulare TaxID=57161 RepID=A0ACC1SYS3_9HYPO|nr:hypothetical protein NM208_g675 [Fusarium decemcellulare]